MSAGHPVLGRIVVAVTALAAAALVGVGAGLALGQLGAGTAADAAAREHLANRSVLIAKALGVGDPPMEVPIRVVDRADWAEAGADCMRSMGFHVDVSEAGTISLPDQSSIDVTAFDRALYRCAVRFPVRDG